jgi:hypothetical protein
VEAGIIRAGINGPALSPRIVHFPFQSPINRLSRLSNESAAKVADSPVEGRFAGMREFSTRFAAGFPPRHAECHPSGFAGQLLLRGWPAAVPETLPSFVA